MGDPVEAHCCLVVVVIKGVLAKYIAYIYIIYIYSAKLTLYADRYLLCNVGSTNTVYINKEMCMSYFCMHVCWLLFTIGQDVL